MNAASRELACALKNHPNCKHLLAESGGSSATTRLLLITGEKNAESTELSSDIVEMFEGKLEVRHITLSELENETPNETIYEAAILSNVFTANDIILDAKQITDALAMLLLVLKTGGLVLIRENLELFNAKLIADMTKLFDLFAIAKGEQTLGFYFYGMIQLKDSIYAKSNFLDVCWTLSKTADEKKTSKGGDCAKLATFREFLDKTQYTEDNVASYEWIFGDNFISPGGINENRRVLGYLRKPRPGQRMLDIGVGIGGGARQAAREFGFHVLGCDLSSNMIQHAFERNQRDKDHRVEYQITDAMVYCYEGNSFDIVFSRDCIQHIADTPRLFHNIYTWLKPGGQMLISMYGRGHGSPTPGFNEYVQKRQYMLRTMEEHRDIANKAGFTNIFTENMTPRFREILLEERDRALSNKREFVEKFGESLFEKLVEGWEDKLGYIDADNHNWLLIRAEKPAHHHQTEAGA